MYYREHNKQKNVKEINIFCVQDLISPLFYK